MTPDRQKATSRLVEWRYSFYTDPVRLAHETIVDTSGGPLGTQSMVGLWELFAQHFDPLLNERFPDGDQSSELSFIQPAYVLTKNAEEMLSTYLAEGYVYKHELDEFTDETFLCLYREGYTKNKLVEELALSQADKRSFFSMPEADARFHYWKTVKRWKPEEASALLLGKEPGVVTTERLASAVDPASPFLRAYLDLLRRIERAIEGGELEGLPLSVDVIDWCIESKIDVPNGLRNSQNAKDHAQETSALALLVEANERIKLLENQLDTERTSVDNMSSRKMRGIYKLILAMAIAEFGFKIGRNNEAASRLEGLIIQLEQKDCVLDYEIYAYIGPKKQTIHTILEEAVCFTRNEP